MVSVFMVVILATIICLMTGAFVENNRIKGLQRVNEHRCIDWNYNLSFLCSCGFYTTSKDIFEGVNEFAAHLGNYN